MYDISFPSPFLQKVAPQRVQITHVSFQLARRPMADLQYQADQEQSNQQLALHTCTVP